jgi:branched-chain amino acid transport system permease protein
VQLFTDTVISGASLGIVYVLFAIGFNLIYSVLREMNFAYGDSLMFATFVAYQVNRASAPLPVIVLAAVLAGGLASLAVNWIAMEPLRRRGGALTLIVSGLGASLILRNVAVQLWGPASQRFPDLFSRQSFPLAGQTMSYTVVWALVVAALAVPLLSALLVRTAIGLRIRALSQDPVAARLVGVPVRRTSAIVYATSGMLGAVAGLLFSSTFGILNVQMGFQATIVAFIASVLGGIGSLWGAVLGGLVLGLAESFVGVYVSTLYRSSFTYALMIVLLLLLPTGILGKHRQARV